MCYELFCLTIVYSVGMGFCEKDKTILIDGYP